MKFKTLKMKNFMRYKGENTIEFSCDEKKNVTIVLGDNTVGKTTIAQAFRWGLYGKIFAERGKRQEDFQFLNYDILEMMDANSRATVSVEITVVDDEKQYYIRRMVEYTRLYPKMETREAAKKLQLLIADKNHVDDMVEVQPEKAQELINELFPVNLSHYFLFDGERWNDVTVNGVRENIKDSVHILTGLSAYQAAMNHLKDMGSNSVVKTFRGKISGSGNMYDDLEKERNQQERNIENYKEKIRILEINIQNYMDKVSEIEEYLLNNQSTENMQKDFKRLQVLRKTQEQACITNYKTFVNEFSDKGYMLLAKPMVDAAMKMVKSVAGERRDIPYMRQASIDHIIKSGTCICGTKIRPGTKEFDALMEQRNFLPPADIGSLLGEFERTGNRWENRSSSLKQDLHEMAEKVDMSIEEYQETLNIIAKLETKMDEQIDFAEKRNKLRYYKQEIQKMSSERGSYLGRIDESQASIERLENQMKSRKHRARKMKNGVNV